MNQVISEKESLVYDIIQKYLKRNKPIEIIKLSKIVSSKINSKKNNDFNSEGVRKILKSLLKKGLIVDGSSLTKKDIMENENRKAIYNFIKEKPGVYHYDILKSLNLGSHIIKWHINVLLDFKFIDTISIHNHNLYFEYGLPEKKVLLHYYKNNKKCEIIIDFLVKNPEGCSKTQISKTLSIHPNTVKKYIEEMDELGIINKKKKSKKIIFYL